MTDRLPRTLDRDEIRVLGCLLEKELATPEYYPLTLNALVAACNQRTNRYPVLSLSVAEVQSAVDRLHAARLIMRVTGGRTTKWKQGVENRWGLDPARKAALAVLLLRGPQTAGEVRGRSTRLHEFGSSDAAEAALADLAGPPDPLVMLLEREPGQKEPRWAHVIGGEDGETAATPPPAPAAREPVATTAAPAPPDFDPQAVLLRLKRLEQQVHELQSALQRLRGATD